MACPGWSSGSWPGAPRSTLGASADLVERAAALGARDARLAPVAAPALAVPGRRRAAVRAEFGVAVDQPLILSVGRLHPQKRYDVLVDAAARWRERSPAPVVLIAGSGPAYLPLAARICAARAPVTLLGHRTDVADLLAGADLAVVTSDWEARQLFAQEAMRAGVPLVATAVGGLPELVGDAAVLVPPGDVDAVDAAVRALLDDGAGPGRAGRRGAARAAAWPTEADTLAQLAALYAELARGPATPDADTRSTGTPLMLRRVAPILLTLLVVVLGITALAARPDAPSPRPSADFVVLVGVAGLRWDDVDPQRTPTLWRMAQEGSIGSLSVRSAHRPTCPLDGWLTLGAGQLRGVDRQPAGRGCARPTEVTVERPDGIGAYLPEQDSVVLHNQDQLPWGAVPGALPSRCAARWRSGRARRWPRPDRSAGSTGTRRRCPRTRPSCSAPVCSASSISARSPATDPAARAAAAREADTQLARVLAARPPHSLVIVAGVADTDTAVAAARGDRRRPGVGERLADLAEHRPPPAICNWSTSRRPRWPRSAVRCRTGLFLGRPAEPVGDRPADLPAAIAEPADADREAAAQQEVAGGFFTAAGRRAGGARRGGAAAAAPRPPARRAARSDAGVPTGGGGRGGAAGRRRAGRCRRRCSPTPRRGGATPHPAVASPRLTGVLLAAAHGRGAARARATAAPSGRSARWPGWPRWPSAWTCSPVPGCNSTVWSATPRWRAAGTPGWAPWGSGCSSPARC